MIGPVSVGAGTYQYHDVNIYKGGSLTFADALITFWAESILVENGSSLVTGSPTQPIGKNGGVVTIVLYGEDQGVHGAGIECKTDTRCGVDPTTWTSNPTKPVVLPGGYSDYFYAYSPLDYDDIDSRAYMLWCPFVQTVPHSFGNRHPKHSHGRSEHSQRSTLTVNNGSYYIDTTVSAATQQAVAGNVNVFHVTQVSTDNAPFTFTPPQNWPWAPPIYDSNTGLLTVTMDMNFPGFIGNYNSVAQNKCQPQSFCKWDATNKSCGCALTGTDSLSADCQSICTKWTQKDVQCPAGGCYGFGVNLPAGFMTGPRSEVPPARVCFPQNAD